jgi:hypothetical protein
MRVLKSMCRDFNDGVAAIPLYSIIVLPFEFLPRDACSLQPWTHLVRRLSDPPDTFRAISKWPGREVAVVVHRVPARPDAAHVGFIFIDVMGNDHSGAPARSIIRRYESHGRLWHPRRTQLYLEGYCAYRRHQRCHWRKRRLPKTWGLPEEMIGRRLSQEEAAYAKRDWEDGAARKAANAPRNGSAPAFNSGIGHGIPGERSNNGVGSGGQDNSSAKNGESREHHSRPGAAGERASCRCVRHPYGGLHHGASSKATAISNVILAISTWPKRAMVNSIARS